MNQAKLPAQLSPEAAEGAVMSTPIPAMHKEPALTMDVLWSGLEALDRGECQELNADTMTRCTGRMVASYVEATRLLPAFPLWTCEQCGRVVVP